MRDFVPTTLNRMDAIMHCSNCGSQLDDDAIFCPECGTKVQDVPAVTTDETVIITPDETVVLEGTDGAFTPEDASGSPIPSQPQQTRQMPATPTQPVTSGQAGDEAKKRRTRLIAIITCAVVALVAIGIFAYVQITAHQRSHTPVPVQVNFAFPDGSDAQPIGVPLAIQGSDLDGKVVDEQVLAIPDGEGIELLAGEYTVSIAGSPASTDGVVYGVEGNGEQSLVVPVPGDEGEQADPAPPVDFDFSVVPANEVSDAQVDAIEQWMEEYGVSANEIQDIGTAIVERRNAEAARIALEQEKQAALAANPSVIPMSREYTDLTGTVRIGYFEVSKESYGHGDVCYLELPHEVEFTGFPYYSGKYSRIILPDSFAKYKDKVVTIKAQYTIESAIVIKEFACSRVWAENPQLVREF